jgi:hypothetical protein
MSASHMRLRMAFGALLLLFLIQSSPAKENWPLSVKVLSAHDIAAQYGSFHFGLFHLGDSRTDTTSSSAAWSHQVSDHVFVEASDQNSYELVPKNRKDMILPGVYKAKIEKRDVMICEPKDNGKCREVRFFVVAAEPTATANERASKPAEPSATPSPAQYSAPAPPPPSAAPVAPVSVAVDSTPPGADIEVDGGFVGNTPSTVTVTLGSHQITIKKEGFEEWSRKLNVTGGNVHLNADLKPAAGSPAPAPK